MSTTANTTNRIAGAIRFNRHEIGGAIGWALVDLGDWLHDVAFRLSGGETPTRDTPSAEALARLGWTDEEIGR